MLPRLAVRWLACAALLVASAAPARALAGGPAATVESDDSDDPKRARLARQAAALAARRRVFTPVFKVSYRRLTARNLDGTDLPFNAIDIDLYPVSRRWFRLGLDLEVGIGAGSFSAYYLTSGLSAGFQYPWRVTPFVDARIAGGLIGGGVAGALLVSYTWVAGLDFGAEVYLFERLHVSAAIGWAHPVYGGIDLAHQRENPTGEPLRKALSADTFTFKVGIGL